MGEYLKTGIIVEFHIYKSEIPKMEMYQEKVGSELASGVVDNPGSFEWKDEGGYFAWKMRLGR